MSVSGACSDIGCKKKSEVYCYHCKKDYCNEHFEKHSSQINVLNEQYHTIRDQLESSQISQVSNHTLAQLFKARDEAFQLVNQAFEKKIAEMQRKFSTPDENLRKADRQLQDMMRKTRVTHQEMDNLEKLLNETDSKIKEIERIKHDLSNVIPRVYVADPDKIDPNINTALYDTINQNHPPLEAAEPDSEEIPFRFSSNHRTFNCSNKSGVAMTCNERSLLIYENERLILLTLDFKVVQSFDWPDGTIYHLTWLSNVHHFLVVNDQKAIFLVNPTNLTAYQRLDMIPEQNWWSATTSQRHLYLSTFGKDPTVVEFDPLFSFRKIRAFKAPFLCKQDESIHQINANEKNLLITISNAEKKMARCDIRTLNTFDLILSCPLKIPARTYQVAIRCCLLPMDEFLIMYEDHLEVLHVRRDGNSTLITHKKPVWNGLLVDQKKLIIRTDRYLLVYPL